MENLNEETSEKAGIYWYPLLFLKGYGLADSAVFYCPGMFLKIRDLSFTKKDSEYAI